MTELDVAIIGGGITGQISALEIERKLGDSVNITLYDNFQESPTKKAMPPSHLGPIGLEVQSGNLWNGYSFEETAEGFGLDCNVTDFESIKWMNTFSKNTLDPSNFMNRQLELYAHNTTGANYFATHPAFAKHVDFNGNLRFFRTHESLSRAARYISSILPIYEFAPIVIDGRDDLIESFNVPSALMNGEIAGAIFYPEDGTGDSLKIQLAVKSEIFKSSIRTLTEKVVEIESNSSGAQVVTKRNKRFKHDVILLCAGIENEHILGLEKGFETFPFIGRRTDLSAIEDLGLDNRTLGFDEELYIMRQSTKGIIQVGGTVIIRNRDDYREKIDKIDTFIPDTMSNILGENIQIIEQRYGVRAMTLDDLPIVRSVDKSNRILMINPTGHQGFLQAPSMAKEAVNYVQNILDDKKTASEIIELEELKRLSLMATYRRESKQQKQNYEKVEKPKGRGSRSNFVALRNEIVSSGRGNLKKPMAEKQKKARRRKRK